ncbi:aminodeoxychorismate/anthranilate synthase component II [Candidatus Micrarchaeota archaeon]|nr:aminodeoxychorismate/anthranilate synthase component II [Candidatus Micrarchaeota archaeon]
MNELNVLLIDNFDSFTYNLYQYVGGLGCKVTVARNNELTIRQIESKKFDKIIISPGPGNPDNGKDFGVCRQVILQLGKTIPILGVCLGHQGIISAFGGRVIRAPLPMHGKTSLVKHNGKGIFAGVKNPLSVMRYHSLVGDEKLMPSCLEVTAKSLDDNQVMAVEHKELPIYGIQFHPESILTEDGKKILKNFIEVRA